MASDNLFNLPHFLRIVCPPARPKNRPPRGSRADLSNLRAPRVARHARLRVIDEAEARGGAVEVLPREAEVAFRAARGW
jgi:hypothetical protein